MLHDKVFLLDKFIEILTSTSKVLVSCSDLILTSFCTSRAAFVVYYISVQKISLLYKCTQKQLTVQVYTKPVYQVYTNPV